MELSKWAKKKFSSIFLYAYFIYMIKLLDTEVSSCFLSFPSSLRTMIYWIIHATPNTIYNSSAKAEPTACSYSKIYQFDLDPTLTPDLFVLLLSDLSLVVDLSL